MALMHSECGYLGFVLIPGPWAGRMGGIGGVGYRVATPESVRPGTGWQGMAMTWQCGGAPRVRVPAMPAPGASGLPWMGLMGIPCGGIVLSACQYPPGVLI